MFALGGGFQPTFTLAQKCEMNGQNKHPVFTYLKSKFPYPYDDPFSLMTNPKFIIWSPVSHSDMAWNLKKFLIGPKRGALPTLQLHSSPPSTLSLISRVSSKLPYRYQLLSTQIYSIQPLSISPQDSECPWETLLDLSFPLRSVSVIEEPCLSCLPVAFFPLNFLVGDSNWPPRLGRALGLHKMMAPP